MSVLKNASIVAVGRGASVIIGFGATVVLARLLTPEDYGVYTIAVGAAALFYALRVFGTGNYLIAEKDINSDTVATVFSITFTLSLAFGLILAAASPLLAAYYENEAVTPTLLIIALGFLINPFATVSQVLLQREERIARIVTVNLTAAVVGAISMITLAYSGAGPIALALGTVISTLVSLIGFHFARPGHLSYRLSFANWAPALRFGGWLTGVSITTQYGEQLPGLILGKTLGLASAGLFDKGNTAAKLPHSLFNSMILMVLFPAIARENREGDDIAGNYAFRLVLLTAVMWPIFIFLALHGEPAVLFVFGPQWGEAGIVASILALMWLFQSPALLGDQILIARGRVRQLFFMRFGLLITRAIGLILFSGYGLAASALCMFVPSVLYALSLQSLVARELGCSISQIARPLVQNLIVLVATVLAGTLASRWLSPLWDLNLLFQLLLGAGMIFFAWWVAVEVSKHPVLMIKKRILSRLVNRA
jgi:O-antigen/teichoic acid export membrane protein